jgi:hypothetical protein
MRWSRLRYSGHAVEDTIAPGGEFLLDAILRWRRDSGVAPLSRLTVGIGGEDLAYKFSLRAEGLPCVRGFSSCLRDESFDQVMKMRVRACIEFPFRP